MKTIATPRSRSCSSRSSRRSVAASESELVASSRTSTREFGGDGARDLDLLLQLDRELADARVAGRRARRARRARRRARRRAAGQSISAAAPRQPAHQDVLGDGQRRRERQLLADRDDPALDRLRAGSRSVDRLAVDLDRAGVGLQRAVEDLHERRLARAVLAGERVDLARPRARSRRRRARATPGNALLIPVIRTSGRHEDASRQLDRLDREPLAGLDRSRRFVLNVRSGWPAG